MRFRLSTLNTAEVNADVLAAWELTAFFLGSAAPDELPMDEDLARENYIEKFVIDDSRDDYRAEPQMADAEMMESFSSALVGLAEQRKNILGDSYPFYITESQKLIRRVDIKLNTVGASYLALQLFRGLHGGTIEIGGDNDAEVKKTRELFERKFRNVFEYVAGYAVAGERSGAPYMTSHCRSARRLEILLNGVCRKVGAGKVLPYEHWNAQHKVANDGGVDCLIHVGGTGGKGNAELALVGASAQKSDIGVKIMGPEKLNYFRRFFSVQPAAFKGILVRPQDEDALTLEKCVEKDCLLFSYNEVWQALAKRDAGQYQTRALVRLDAKARRLLKEFSGAVFQYEYEEYSIQVA